MSALGGHLVKTNGSIFNIATGRFYQQQSFKLLQKPFCEGLESAISGRF